MTHIDLFTGIGGFSIAAQAAGFTTIAMCEFDPFRRAGLARAWPGVSIIEDVREFHWPMADTEQTGREGADTAPGEDGLHPQHIQGPTLLTAGVPCAPASRAGKQRGKGDDRWLWPEAVRILGEARPRFALFENPPGILDVGLDGVLSDVEAQGYEIRAILNIPACAVNAPHRRERLWIVAHDEGEPERPGLCEEEKAKEWRGRSGDCDGPWSDYQWLPCGDNKFRRAPSEPFFVDDGIPKGLSRKLVAALGDSIVPQVAYQVLRAIKEEIDMVQGG